MSEHERSEEIREDITETRRDMGRKIDAIQGQLSTENLKVKAKEVIDEFATSTADSLSEYMRTNMGDIGHTIADTLKRNPVPAALVGLGLGWLFVETFASERPTTTRYPLTRYRPQTAYAGSMSYEPSDRYMRERYSSSGADQPGFVERVGEKVSDAAHSVKDKAEEWAGQVQERASDATDQVQWEAQRMRDEARLQGHLAAMDARDQVSDWQQQGRSYTQQASSSSRQYADRAASYVGHSADEARGYVQDAASQVNNYAHYVGDQAQHYAQQAGHQAYAAGEQVIETMEENPLTFGIVALAAGAAIGMILPQTRRENEWLGTYRDRVADTASAAASDVMTHAQEAVEEIRPEVERSAQKIIHDVQETGRTMVQDLKQTGETVKQEAKDVGNHAKDVMEQKSQETQADVKERVNTADHASTR
ncbi:MAG: hypothetical protein R2867_10780 [Caldilineaceae bacterium]